MTRNSILAYLSIAAFALVGCGSSTSETPDAGLTQYGLSGGDNCYTIIAVAPGSIDGCGLGVDSMVGQSLPMNYTKPIVQLGTNGSLGGGEIANNTGTLNRANDPTITGTTCTLHQTDDSILVMLADNKFTVSVTEVESQFSATCGTLAPAGGTCTSTWTWTMQRSIDPTLLPPLCGATP